VRRIARYLPLCFLALGSVQFASAQTSFDVNMGFGSFHDKAAAPFGTDSVTGNPCSSTVTDPNCEFTTTNGLGGFFLGFGMDLMLKKSYGLGFSWDLTPAKSNFETPQSVSGVGTVALQYRQHFIDFNGIYSPINNKKFQVKLTPGIGVAKFGISENVTQCVTNTICASEAEPFPSANHFDIHMGVGLQIYLTDHVFVRPQFDYHYVPNLTEEFGSNSVFGGMVWVGYSWGDR
jgi:opacity protein-like surface antigen